VGPVSNGTVKTSPRAETSARPPSGATPTWVMKSATFFRYGRVSRGAVGISMEMVRV